MDILLPADLQAQVDAQVATGEYRSSEEVLREALAVLERRRRQLAKLREMVEEAEADVAAGRVGPFDRELLKSEVRAALAAQGIRE